MLKVVLNLFNQRLDVGELLFATVKISNVSWDAAPGSDIEIGAYVSDNLHLENVDMLSDGLVKLKDSCKAPYSAAPTFAATACRFKRGLTLASCLSKTSISGSEFMQGGLTAYNGSVGNNVFMNHEVWNLTIFNSSFLDGSSIAIDGYNAVIRWSRFYLGSRAVDAGWDESVIRLLSTVYYPDARGNFWGHTSGPFSCCNVKSPGVFAIDADTSSWCLDEECFALSAPFANNSDFGYKATESPPLCQYESYCPVAGDRIPIGVGVAMSVILIICLVVSLISSCRRRHYEPLEDPELPGERHRTLLFLNSVSIVLALFFVVYAVFPIIYPQERQTNVSIALRTWYIFFGGLVAFSRALRIASAVWNTVILRRGDPKYPTMLGQIVFSSFALQFTFALRFSEVVTDPLSIFAFLHGDEHLLPLYQPLGSVIAVARANWIFYMLLAISDVCLAIPQIILSLNIARKRDFREVESLKQQLSQNPLIQAAPQAPQIRKAAFIVSWFFFADAILFLLICVAIALFYGLFVFAVAFTRGPLVASFSISFLSRLVFLVGCFFALILGFALFRWKFVESSWIMNYIALCVGVSASLLQFGVYYFFALSGPIPWHLPLYAAISLGGSLFLAIVIMIPTILAFRLIRRMRLELAAAFTSSIYEQLEDALT
jgi:hypothetical protein